MIGVNQRDLFTFEVDHRTRRPDGEGDSRPRGAGRRVGGSRTRRRAHAPRRRLRRDPGRRDARHGRRSALDCHRAAPIELGRPATWRRTLGDPRDASLYCSAAHVREDLRDHQRGRRTLRGGDGRRRGRFHLRPARRGRSPPQQVYDITRRLPPEVLTVGVFRDELPGRVVEIAHRAGVKAVQLHGRETPDQTIEIGRSIRWVIKAFAATSPDVSPRRSRTAPTSCCRRPVAGLRARCSTGAWRPRCRAT